MGDACRYLRVNKVYKHKTIDFLRIALPFMQHKWKIKQQHICTSDCVND